MTITDEAKKIMETALHEDKNEAFRFVTSRGCCGNSLTMTLVELGPEDLYETLNGLNIVMDDETKSWTDTVTIEADGERLLMKDSAASCSCGDDGCC